MGYKRPCAWGTAEIEAVVADMDRAKVDKDYAEANSLRNKLFGAGITLNMKSNRWRTGDGRSGEINTNRRRAGSKQDLGSGSGSQHWPRPNARGGVGGRQADNNGMGSPVGGAYGQKPRGAATGRAKGDWCCPGCSNINYARRTSCNRCRAPKAAGSV